MYRVTTTPFKISLLIFSTKLYCLRLCKAFITLFQLASVSTLSQYWNIFVQRSSTLRSFSAMLFKLESCSSSRSSTPRSCHFGAIWFLICLIHNLSVGLSVPVEMVNVDIQLLTIYCNSGYLNGKFVTCGSTNFYTIFIKAVVIMLSICMKLLFQHYAGILHIETSKYQKIINFNRTVS